jgi:uncharacterized protein YcnI
MQESSQEESAMRIALLTAVLTFTVSAMLLAHVEMRPQTSTPGAEQQYTLRAHNESKAAVVAVTLNVPTEVTVTEVEKPSVGSYDVKKDGTRIVSITWTREIKQGAFADFRFRAKNPVKGPEIQWHAREEMADGTAIDWGGTVAGTKKGPTTRLTPAAAPAAAGDHDHQHQ